MGGFDLVDHDLALPSGASARATRRVLRHDGRLVLGLNQGLRRSYVYPVLTPKGFAVTSEAPADHPHHNSLWIASDCVNLLRPVGDAVETYTYNFYVDESFQGRAPCTIAETACAFSAPDPLRCEIRQEIAWTGPAEWGAPRGRLVAHEERTMTVSADGPSYRIGLVSRLRAVDWPLSIGPTRHAYFNLRVAEWMSVAHGGNIRDDRDRAGADRIGSVGARWVDVSGPVGGGHRAGVTVVPHPCAGRDYEWFVADWGAVSAGPFRSAALVVKPGEIAAFGCDFFVHDGDDPVTWPSSPTSDPNAEGRLS